MVSPVLETAKVAMLRQNMMSKATGTVPTTHDIQIRVFCIIPECKLISSIFRANEFGSGDGIRVPPKRLKVSVIPLRNNQADCDFPVLFPQL